MLFKMFPVPLASASWNSESSARFDISVLHPSTRDVDLHFKLGGSERECEPEMDWAYININLERERCLNGGDPNLK